MKNRIKLKQYLFKTLIVIGCLSGIFLALNSYEYHKYTKNYNHTLMMILAAVKEQYPQVTEQELLEIINNPGSNDLSFLTKYGIDLNKDSLVLVNEQNYHHFLIINIAFFLLSILGLFLLFIKYNLDKEKEIKNITKYIEEINKKNYELQIDSMSEDELSILKNEIYKTTIMLKEAAENSHKDKVNLKSSLEDITHQLKTPLTSILIMLDNLIDDEDMKKDIRNDFIRDIKREVISMNFLVQALLKLSKFDANTIHFNKEKSLVSNIILEAVKNVSLLCDLKNINISTTGDKDIKLLCDAKWQIEALTNILKNSIEHSSENQELRISYEQNQVYTLIQIEDFAGGITKKDLPHIFERFYQGSNSSKENVGIGLALAKTIIEKDNGTISVERTREGTIFIIKYYS